MPASSPTPPTATRPPAPLPRPSLALRRHHRTNRALLSLPESSLASQMACRGGHPTHELRHAARSTNKHIRGRYADFIHDVGRNVYPLIVFTDHEVDGPDGVGSTLTLYRADGSVMQASPALGSSYEQYKACSHVFMGLGVEIGPYLDMEDAADSHVADDGSGVEEKKDEETAAAMKSMATTEEEDEDGVLQRSNRMNEVSKDYSIEDVPWRAGLLEYARQIRVFRRALIRATEAEAAVVGMEKLSLETTEAEGIHDPRLPSPELRETMCDMLSSAIDFCESCLATGTLDVQRWKELNHANFPRIKKCMQAATKAQADACVRQIVEWRDLLGPQEWRELYVVIPTVWAVDGENPRKTMMRQLMDEDRVDTHIITSEYPRDHSEAKMLLGRVVGDRAIGRFVFGNDTKEREVKTMGLSSEIDVVQDDALPAIWNAVKENGCPVRQGSLRSSFSSMGSYASTTAAETAGHRTRRESGRPSFC